MTRRSRGEVGRQGITALLVNITRTSATHIALISDFYTTVGKPLGFAGVQTTIQTVGSATPAVTGENASRAVDIASPSIITAFHIQGPA